LAQDLVSSAERALQRIIAMQLSSVLLLLLTMMIPVEAGPFAAAAAYSACVATCMRWCTTMAPTGAVIAGPAGFAATCGVGCAGPTLATAFTPTP